jgi:hypothetical protein
MTTTEYQSRSEEGQRGVWWKMLTTRCPARQARVTRLVVGQTMYDVPMVCWLLKYVTITFGPFPSLEFHPSSSYRETVTSVCLTLMATTLRADPDDDNATPPDNPDI